MEFEDVKVGQMVKVVADCGSDAAVYVGCIGNCYEVAEIGGLCASDTTIGLKVPNAHGMNGLRWYYAEELEET